MVNSLVNTVATVLVVNDSSTVLEAVIAVLKGANFHVLQADSGTKALTLAAHHPGTIDLLLSNMTTDGMAGVYLAEALRESRPFIQVMFVSGNLSLFNHGSASIPEPFLPLKLLETINDVLHPPQKSTRLFIAGTHG